MDRADILNRLRLQKSAADPLDSDAYAAKLQADAANWNNTYAEQAKKWDEGSAARTAQFDADAAKRNAAFDAKTPPIPDSERSDEWKKNFAESEAFQKQTPVQRSQWEAEQQEITDTAPARWKNALVDRMTSGILGHPANIGGMVNLMNQAKNIPSELSGMADRFRNNMTEGLATKPDVAGTLAGQITKANPSMLSSGASSPELQVMSKNWKAGDWIKFGTKYYQTDPEGAKTIAWAKTKQWLQNYWPVLAAGGVSLVAMYAMLSAKNKPQAAEEPTGPRPFNYARLMGRY